MKSKIMILLVAIASFSLSGCSVTTPTDETRNVSESTTISSEKSISKQDMTIISERNTDIYSTIYLPEKDNDKEYPLVVLLHGFIGSRKGDLNALDSAGIRLSENGVASIAIDFPGCGDSEEPYFYYTNTAMENDVHSAINYMAENYSIDTTKIGLLGHSMGGRIASLMAGSDIAAVALWSPAAANGSAGIEDFMSGKENVEKMYEQAQKDGKVLFQDWGTDYEVELSPEFFEETFISKPLDTLHAYEGPLFMAIGAEDDAIPRATFDDVIDSADNTSVLVRVIKDSAGHSFENVTDDKDTNIINDVIEKTIDFFIREIGS